MASKFFPAIPRVGRQLFHQIPKSQCRPFSAGPQRYSDTLAVVRMKSISYCGISDFLHHGNAHQTVADWYCSEF